MNYQKEFGAVGKQYGVEIFNNPFVFRSLLSDLIGSSKVDNELLDAFFLLNKTRAIYQSIKDLSLKEAKELIKIAISESDTKYSKIQYVKSIEPLLMIIFPNEYVPISNIDTKVKAVKCNVINKNHPNPQLAQQTPQIVVNKPPKAPKKVYIPKVFNPMKDLLHIALIAPCEKLAITHSPDNRVHVIDDKGIDVMLNMKMWHRDDFMRLELPSDNRLYKVQFPKKHYYSLRIEFDGSVLSIAGDKSKPFSTTKLEINAKDCNSNLNIKVSAFVCNQIYGNVFVQGKINNIYADLQDANINCSITSVTGNYYCVESKKGNIELTFTNSTVKPKVNHFFKKTRVVSGKYKLGNHEIKLDLNTTRGIVKVK